MSNDWIIDPETFLSNSGMAQTVPENEGTILAQIDQLGRGDRKVVMLPDGTQLPSRKALRDLPDGVKMIKVPGAGFFIFNQTAISPKDIRQAVKNNKLTEILGAADGGMGAPDKTKVEGEPVAVVGRGPKGETTQGTITDTKRVKRTIRQTAKVTPKGGRVSVESPNDEIANRASSILYGDV